MYCTGAQIILGALKEEHVTTLFGYPGAAIMAIHDELHRDGSIRHILCRHEQAVIHAADGFARAGGGVGVALVTSGPGLTNAVTGLATAYSDHTPLVLISGQVATDLMGTNAFQEVDAVRITAACTKKNYLVRSIEELPGIIKAAFATARSGSPGPVHIDIPKDIITATISGEALAAAEEKPLSAHSAIPTEALDALIHKLRQAKRPIAIIGGGAASSGAYEAIREFLSRCNIPAVETLMGRGVCGSAHPMLLGMVGMHGTYAANMAVSHADCIISFGARFDDRVTAKSDAFGTGATIIQIDIEAEKIAGTVPVDLPIIGDLFDIVPELIRKTDQAGLPSYEAWLGEIREFERSVPLRYDTDGTHLKPQQVITEIGHLFGDRAIISTDVGQHQMWCAQFYPFARPRDFITSGGLGTMGFGFPAAMGAKLARSDKMLVNITGDGSILMNIQEMMSALQHGIQVINVILNNNFLGMVRQWQTLFLEERFAQTDLSLQPDFAALAASFGGKGFRVTTLEALHRALEEAALFDGPSLIDVEVARFEQVLPMVAPGKALKDMITL